MKKILISLLAALIVPCGTFAQTTTQVAGNGQTYAVGGITVVLLNPQALFTNKQSFLTFNPLFNGQFSYGSNGIGVAQANQFFVGQFKITNGAGVGSNVLNLHTFAFSNSGTTITAPSDAVGNPYSLLNLKCLAIQNLGVLNAPSETNILIVNVPSSAIAFTNGVTPYIEGVLEGPPTNAVVSNTPCLFKYSLGDVGWPVGATTTNSIFFTNPIAGSVILVNVYALGSTNQ